MPPRYIRLTYPPGAAAALPDDEDRFVVGGGGGKGKTGVPNRLTLLKLGDAKLTEEVTRPANANLTHVWARPNPAWCTTSITATKGCHVFVADAQYCASVSRACVLTLARCAPAVTCRLRN